jgi:hypothetical protein
MLVWCSLAAAAIERELPRLEDDAHPAAPDLAQQLEVAQALLADAQVPSATVHGGPAAGACPVHVA